MLEAERRAQILAKMFLSRDAIGSAIGLFFMTVGNCMLLLGVASVFVRVKPGRFAFGIAMLAGVVSVLLVVMFFVLG